MTAREAMDLLQQMANPEVARFLQRYFKTGPGQYGEGDLFLGIKVPPLRALARRARAMALEEVGQLLASEFHEARLVALLIWVDQYARQPGLRATIVRSYLASTSRINNWDLVDQSAPGVVGQHLLDHGDGSLDLGGMARSSWLWDRRIAVLSTLTLIRADRFGPTLQLCSQLLDDPEDLMHKACGWMLRELGKRHHGSLLEFLESHAAGMPRTMLRYAIERFPEEERQSWLRRPAIHRRSGKR